MKSARVCVCSASVKVVNRYLLGGYLNGNSYLY